ncbi:MAG: sulfatase-like hydrolase/transferase, partial [Blastopirellula sp. JB062]
MTRLVSATLALSLSLASWSATQAEKYNFVLIMADDLGANQISPYSDQGVATPHLEQMARQGMQFDTCYATPNCSVTRMMLMTGRYGFRTGWCEFLERPYSPQPGTPQFDIGAAEITFADLLKRQGYVTGIAGKWQLPGSPEDRIFDCGFDTYRMWRWKHPLPDSAASTDPQATASLHLPKKSNRYWDPEVI